MFCINRQKDVIYLMNAGFDGGSLVVGSVGGGKSHLEGFGNIDLDREVLIGLNEIAVLVKEFHLNGMLQVQRSGPAALR